MAARSGIAWCTVPGRGSEGNTRGWSSGYSRGRRTSPCDDGTGGPEPSPSARPLPDILRGTQLVLREWGLTQAHDWFPVWCYIARRRFPRQLYLDYHNSCVETD